MSLQKKYRVTGSLMGRLIFMDCDASCMIDAIMSAINEWDKTYGEDYDIEVCSNITPTSETIPF